MTTYKGIFLTIIDRQLQLPKVLLFKSCSFSYASNSLVQPQMRVVDCNVGGFGDFLEVGALSSRPSLPSDLKATCMPRPWHQPP